MFSFNYLRENCFLSSKSTVKLKPNKIFFFLIFPYPAVLLYILW